MYSGAVVAERVRQHIYPYRNRLIPRYALV